MLAVDMAELEKLTDLFVRSASDAEETLSRLRYLSSEMQEDVELPMYEQTPFVLESVSLAIDALNRGNDTLQSLKNVIAPIADVYRENERKNMDALSRMTATMESMNVGFQAAMETNTLPCLEQSEDALSQSKVEQLVAQSAAEMEIANIAAITKTVEEEYEIREVKDLGAES